MNGSSSSNASVALTQVRGKTKTARNKDEEGGLVVRLLKNIPEYGPKSRYTYPSVLEIFTGKEGGKNETMPHALERQKKNSRKIS